MRRVAVALLLMLLTSCTAGEAATVTVTATSTRTVPSTTKSAGTSATTVPPATTSPATTTKTATKSLEPSKSTPKPGSTQSKPTSPVGCAQQILSSLTTAQRVGQLMMVGLPADAITSDLPRQPVGGVFLSGHSSASASALSTQLAKVQQSLGKIAGVKLHVAVDQEGGYVQTLQGEDFSQIPTAVEQGKLDTSALHDATVDWSTQLVKAGITLDLAPVADVVPDGTADENPPIGKQDRQYGSTAQSVSQSVTTVVSAMLGVKLGTTVKHFPGLGRVRANTDTSTAAVDDQTNPDDEALQPFRDAISAQTTAVMISNASYPNLDPDHLAAFSTKIITGLLRNSMHFNRLVISDDLGSAVAVSALPVGQRAVDFVAAGGDMVLTVQPTDLAAMTAALTSEAKTNATFASRVSDAAMHVLQSKQSLGMISCITPAIPSS